jgi:MFS family permease
VVAPHLALDFHLDAGQLGSLTALYFLGFAAMQVPIGACLDRFGPVMVQVPLYLLAALGAAAFSFAQSPWQLAVGRLLIGVGVAAGLVAGLKTIALWFSKERVPIVNGIFIAFGTLGAVAATAPTEWLLTIVDWRCLFLIMACTLALIGGLLLLVPRTRELPSDRSDAAAHKYTALLRDPRFWRLAPLSGMSIGSAWALQGLWAASWLSDVAVYDRASVVAHLFVMSLALSAGALGLGAVISILRRHGIGPTMILPGMAALLMAAELILALCHPMLSTVPWCLVAFMGAGTVATYSITATVFEKAMLGRVNGAINLCHIGGAFVVQIVAGLVISHWPQTAPGHYPALAYSVMFGVLLFAQGTALIWYLRPVNRADSPVVPLADLAHV